MNAGHASRAHALLSPSGAHRWMNCHRSVQLEQMFQDTTSDAAREGTLAHEICERKLHHEIWEDLKGHELYQQEMDHYTDEYVDAIDAARIAFKKEPYMSVETKLDLSGWIPGGFGTADCILIGDDTIVVIDFKYGKGVPVFADHNEQMMIYALGAMARYSLLFDFHTVRLQIIQPRIDNNSTWECSVDELIGFGERVKIAAQLALKAEEDAVPGDWCRFCRARQKCRARADENVRLAFAIEKKPPLITNDEVGDYLTKGRQVKTWLSDLEEYALSECLAGRSVAGWKAVAGRANRKFDNVDDTFKSLIAQGIDESMLYERKPITLTAVEKMLGKKKFAEMTEGHIIQPPGKPTLVVESDKRDAISNVVTAAEAFAE